MSASEPVAVLPPAVSTLLRVSNPIAVLPPPFVRLLRAPAPSDVLPLPRSSALISAGTAKQASASVMRSKPSHEGDRLIEIRDGVVIFVFIFSVEAGLLSCSNCNPVPRGTGNH